LSARVPWRRPTLDTALVKAGNPVLAGTWGALAGLSNFLRGTGAQSGPSWHPRATIEGGSTLTLRSRFKSRSTAIARIWCVVAVGGPGARVSLGGVERPVSTDRNFAEPIVQTLAAQDNTVQDALLVVGAVGGTVTLLAVSVYEQTRPVLQRNATDRGVDLEDLRPRQPILDATASQASAGGIWSAYANADARRSALFSWSGSPVSRAAGAAVYMFEMPFHIVPRKIYVGDGETAIRFGALARVTSGTGYLRFVTTSVTGTLMPVTSASAAWITESLFIPCEDPTSAVGWATSGPETGNLALTGPDTGTIEVLAVGIWEE
jgi:hypothetical protein